MKANNLKTRVRAFRAFLRWVPEFMVDWRGVRRCLFCDTEQPPHGNGKHFKDCQLIKILKKEGMTVEDLY